MAYEIGGMVSKQTTSMLIVSGIIFAAIIALCLFIAFGIVRALKEMIANFQDIAEGEGDLTKRIQIQSKDEIAHIQGSTDVTVKGIEEISTVINSVNEIVGTMATAVEEQSVATREIATNIGQASQGIQEVNENVNQSSAAAGQITQDIAMVNQSSAEMASSSGQVKKSAEDLKRMATELNAIVGSFKA